MNEWASWLSLKRILAVIQPLGHKALISESRKRIMYSDADSLRSLDQLKHSDFRYTTWCRTDRISLLHWNLRRGCDCLGFFSSSSVPPAGSKSGSLHKWIKHKVELISNCSWVESSDWKGNKLVHFVALLKKAIKKQSVWIAKTPPPDDR